MTANSILQARNSAPHEFLGPHRYPDGWRVRAFMPQAGAVIMRLEHPERRDLAMVRIAPEGLFEAVLPSAADEISYRLIIRSHAGEHTEQFDPYAFIPDSWDSADQDAFLSGNHARLFEKLGAHLRRQAGVMGTAFAVWAPAAERVSVVGSFNEWDGRRHPMRKCKRSGIWELFIPGVPEGSLYKFEIRSLNGCVFLKADPFARLTERAPATASIVGAAAPDFVRADSTEQATRASAGTTPSVSIPVQPIPGYSPAFDRSDPAIPATRPGPDQLPEPRRHRQFAEIPPSPETAQPERASLFAPFEHPEKPERLRSWIASQHREGRAVVVRIVDSSAPQVHAELAYFDGTPLYERGPESVDSAGLLDLAKPEIQSFVVSNAVFWRDVYHADGWATDQACARVLRGVAHSEGEQSAEIPIFVRPIDPSPHLDNYDITRLLAGRHDKPHSILGCHERGSEYVVRALLPHATRAWVRFAAEPEIRYELGRIHERGLFQTTISLPVTGNRRYSLIVADAAGNCTESLDTYAFREFDFTAEDQRRFGNGWHYSVYERLGAHPGVRDGVSGVRFAVWAPNAEGVSVVGTFNDWDALRHPMHRHGLSGVWELFIPEIRPGDIYQYAIHARGGATCLKADPYAFRAEIPPATASVVRGLPADYRWHDQDWLARRQAARSWEQPIAIYEVHLGSWSRDEHLRSLSYRALGERLIPYVKELGFTHIELLPIAEHPYEPSWGYQVTGYFAPTSRYGEPQDLMWFIDQCHQNGIGVLLDWVPGHFPKDAHGLARFDGTSLYEHEDPRKGEHRDWGTLIFNYGRHEVANFLIANALFWLKYYHFDGIRVDAVASMLYLDYSRQQPGEWVPNQYGGRENLEAIDFLRHANSVIHREYPGVMVIAEESTAWPNVSRPVDQGGLGFGYKWNMGWMHDVLHYLARSPEERRACHHNLTFSLHYAFAENYVLALSHDEVVHMKRSLLQKMPGCRWEQFANLRLLFALMYAHPGKKLLFMGDEFGQIGEWNHAAALEWQLLETDGHRQLHTFLKELNGLYRSDPAFFEVDFKSVGFEWIDADNAADSTIAFLRKAKDPRRSLLFMMNFSAISIPGCTVGVPYPVRYRIIFNTNWHRFGGADKREFPEDVATEEVDRNGRDFAIRLALPALTAVVLRPEAPAD